MQPDRAYFGEKDAQQLAVIRRMVVDLNMPVEIVGVPTVREADGLALSSRNVGLAPAERTLAIALFHALQAADRLIAGGERDPGVVQRAATATIPANPVLKLEYLDIVDPEDMQPVNRITKPVRVAGALWVGSTRLIDNVLKYTRDGSVVKCTMHECRNAEMLVSTALGRRACLHDDRAKYTSMPVESGRFTSDSLMVFAALATRQALSHFIAYAPRFPHFRIRAFVHSCLPAFRASIFD